MQATSNVEDVIWDRVLAINLSGVMRACRKVIPYFIENNGSIIINMASLVVVMDLLIRRSNWL
ncbi:hypothetical protein DEX24_07140 [Kurthia sibirica]|uniref:Uncharacterized protein n=1 Tax=Kurthia sibirica TaxID=202750 RepID=A0A2U3AMC1_9BACL|nr:hypothetical protein DEX24_07140 [Kurthia sibirica]